MIRKNERKMRRCVSADSFDDYIAVMKALGMDRYIEIQQLAIDPYYKD